MPPAQLKVVQPQLQRAVGLTLEYVGGDAAGGLGSLIGSLALGTPVGRAVDDLVISTRVDDCQVVIGESAAKTAQRRSSRSLPDLI